MKRKILSIILMAAILLSSGAMPAFAVDDPQLASAAPDTVQQGEQPSQQEADAVRELIAALPDAEALAAMSTEEQNQVYDALLAADDAYQALNEEQKGRLAGENAKLDALFAYFNSPNMAAPAADNIEYIDENGETRSCASATDVTSTAIAWGTSGSETWYYVRGTITISGRVTVSGNVHLILANGCNLTVSGGIGVNEGNSFTIYAQSVDADAMGSLTATNVADYNAGIGATDTGNNSGAVTINGGTVTATGGENGAGIGGVSIGNGSNITINDGVVTATGGDDAAGIGGGYMGSGSHITINGGVVKAYGSSGSVGGGAGIGGGYMGSGSHITINGGTVTANGGKDGAGIGGGYSGSGSHITISNGVVEATGGGNSGAGIGGGGGDTFGGSGSDITISGGDVKATGSTGIGGGYGSSSGGAGDVTISGGTVKADASSGRGAGIGGGVGGTGGAGNVTITGGIVTATGGSGGAGIGGGCGSNWGGVGGAGTVEITGGTVTANGGTGGAGIGGGSSGTGGMGNVTISDGDVTANGGDGGAGIGGGYGQSTGGAGTVEITGGDVTAKGGDNAVDIGGGSNDSDSSGTSEVKISGGTVTTEGGDGGIGGTPDISGGTVNGTSHDPAPAPGPAAGGSGSGSSAERPGLRYVGGGYFESANVGAAPTAVLVDGEPVPFTGDETGFEIDLTGLAPGRHSLTVRWGSRTLRTEFDYEGNAIPEIPAIPEVPVTDIPKTGDNSRIGLPIGLMMLGLAGIGFSVMQMYRRKREN